MSRRQVLLALLWLWSGFFFVLPLLIVLKISVAEARLGVPPYTSFFDAAHHIAATLDNYRRLVEDSLYIKAYLGSLKTALISTVIALLIGYPMAYAIARAPAQRRNLLLILVMLPFWTSFLVRIYAWIGLLRPTGVINNALIAMGWIDEPLRLINTSGAVYLGIVYAYLPFMVLPLYARLEKLDPALLEAARDLGATSWRACSAVTLPLSMPGIIAGCLLVFIPAVGEFVIPELLGGPNALMIGRVLWNEFFTNRDWPVASAVTVVLLILLVAPIVWVQRLQARGDLAP